MSRCLHLTCEGKKAMKQVLNGIWTEWAGRFLFTNLAAGRPNVKCKQRHHNLLFLICLLPFMVSSCVTYRANSWSPTFVAGGWSEKNEPLFLVNKPRGLKMTSFAIPTHGSLPIPISEIRPSHNQLILFKKDGSRILWPKFNGN